MGYRVVITVINEDEPPGSAEATRTEVCYYDEQPIILRIEPEVGRGIYEELSDYYHMWKRNLCGEFDRFTQL